MTRDPRPSETDLRDLLELEVVEENIFRANYVFHEEQVLYGGQVAAQALLAAGRTVDADRLPHSLHGYFLRSGDSSRPTVYQVWRDRDGRSFSARRVVALQNGEVIFSMSASFHTVHEGPGEQHDVMPAVPEPLSRPAAPVDRLFSFETWLPEQPYGGRARWPLRLWARATVPLPDEPLLQAAALTYLSDLSSGVLPAPDGSAGPSSSLDHAVWLHRPLDLNDWVLVDFQPHTAGRGRGWFTGSIFTPDGRLGASVAQEVLYR